VQSALASSVIVQNDVGANDVGVYQVDSVRCCTVALNRIHNNRYFGIVIQDGDGTAHDNVITGGRIGIGVVADFVDTTGVLVNNRISRTTAADVREIDCCGYRATAIVS
jgi:parallel beta-helix repeat protein